MDKEDRDGEQGGQMRGEQKKEEDSETLGA